MKPLAVTMGDPAGIGPEIVVKLAQEWPEGAPFVVIGNAELLQTTASALDIDVVIRSIETAADTTITPRTLNVINVGTLPTDLLIGQVSAPAGQAAYDYVARAINDSLSGEIAGIVTAPINKEALRLAGLNYPGHTEILADLSNTDEFTMMMSSEDLRVVLVTIHEALKVAIAHIDEASILRAIRLANVALTPAVEGRPRIGVAGLNPHAGENGLMGREEIEIIRPAIDRAISEGIDASGPFPPDTIFMRAKNGDFDVVIAQYHDQGLIPFKYLGLDKGVNVTIGLPFIRTSVDHGTAFEIVGLGVADHSSLRVAYEQAITMIGTP